MFLITGFSSGSTKPIKQSHSLIAVPPIVCIESKLVTRGNVVFENPMLMILVRHATGRFLQVSLGLQYSSYSIRCHVPDGWIPCIKKHKVFGLSLEPENESSSASTIRTCGVLTFHSTPLSWRQLYETLQQLLAFIFVDSLSAKNQVLIFTTYTISSYVLIC